MTRKPAVAGSFYPAGKENLSAMIDGFLRQAQIVQTKDDLKILVVPHAGLIYSGQVAAWGFKQIESKKYTRVILLGVSHQSWFDHAAIYKGEEWETPLGVTEIDKDLSGSLRGDKIIFDTRPHEEEHSLEVELVFLQRVLKDFRIVPVLLGQVADRTIDILARKISRNLNEKTLLVVSSDLSHYPSWSDANKVDNKTMRAILSGSKAKFEETIRNIESEGYSNLDTCACGQKAVSVALKVAAALCIKDIRKIRYQNSGDITGDKSRVVGYGAVGVWAEEKFLKKNRLLDEKAQKEALLIARRTLEDYFGGIVPVSLISPISPILSQPFGAFVTLRNKKGLRGCIGVFEPDKPLYKVIQEMAIAAATEDSRFLPVTADELKDIDIEISVMTPKKKISDCKEIELGKHGVVIQKGFRSGTFLPQVATETGWNKEEFLSQLCSQKAGLPPDCYKDPSVNLYVFEAQVFGE